MRGYWCIQFHCVFRGFFSDKNDNGGVGRKGGREGVREEGRERGKEGERGESSVSLLFFFLPRQRCQSSA